MKLTDLRTWNLQHQVAFAIPCILQIAVCLVLCSIIEGLWPKAGCRSFSKLDWYLLQLKFLKFGLQKCLETLITKFCDCIMSLCLCCFKLSCFNKIVFPWENKFTLFQHEMTCSCHCIHYWQHCSPHQFSWALHSLPYRKGAWYSPTGA
jgi:hypothetical protein